MGNSPEQIEQILDYLFAYGAFWVYLAIFLACFIENLFPPFPGDTFIVAAGLMVGLGRLDMLTSLVIVNVGGMVSVGLLYWLGRERGRRFFERHNYRWFSMADIDAMEARFDRWGALILIVSRFVVGMRAALAIAAGIGRYPLVRMVLFSLISYLIFTGLVMFLSIKTMENLDRIQYYFSTYNMIAWPIVIALLMFVVGRKIVKVRKGKDA